MTHRVDAKNERQTWDVADTLAAVARPGDVIALWGDLGAGKTAFARAFVNAACGCEQEVPSPTFTLVQTYDAPMAEIWHFDLYRLSSPDEAFELGIEVAFADGISLIEWPDRLGAELPANRLDVTLEHVDAEDARTIRVRGHGTWEQRVREISFD